METKTEKIQTTFDEHNPPININSEITSNKNKELKEKWNLILTKIELPSTRMLLSQQAKLVGILKNSIEISLAPNWENMIKSRKPLIDDAVKKIFGNQMTINFISEKDFQTNSEPDLFKSNKNESKKNETTKKIESKSKLINEDNESDNQKSPKNLANFFNGEIIDIQD